MSDNVENTVKQAVKDEVNPAVKQAVKDEILPAITTVLDTIQTIQKESQKPQLDATKPWFLSKSVIGGVIAAIASVAGLYGADINQEEMETILISVGGIIGSILAIYGRLTAKTVLTKK